MKSRIKKHSLWDWFEEYICLRPTGWIMLLVWIVLEYAIVYKLPCIDPVDKLEMAMICAIGLQVTLIWWMRK